MSTSTVSDHAGAWSVPGYAEQRELSHGAFERVVEAVQEGTGRRVAIKYLGPDLVRTPDFLSRFRNQVLKLIELDVPSVVRVYDYAAQPGHGAAVVMELVNGVSLSDMIERQGPLDPEAALAVLKATLLGLAAVHRLGFGHRDIRPGNMLVDNEGQVKLTNFGVAAPAAGTPAYLAPERWEGDPGSPASELYAATAAFFECLTGAPPFSGDLARLQEQHESGALPLDRVDAQLAPLIETGMAKDWASRPDSANGFVSELEAVAATAYGSDWEERGRSLLAARAATPLSRGGRQNPPGGAAAAVGGGRRSRLEVIVAIAAAVIVVAAIATAVTLSGGGHKATLSGSLSAGTPGSPTYSAVANVTPPVAASKCTAPTAFTYSATISSTAIGTVKYQWVYSSGAPGPVRVVSFTEAGNRVVTGATVKVKRAGRGWAELKLFSPVPKTSRKATYRLLCGASRGGITATAAVQPATRTASCVKAPPPFTADGSITAAKAETVSYYWAQSDGRDSPLATLTFARPGTLAAEPLTITPQPASGSGEVVLVVTSPVVAASGPATYTLSCLAPKTPVTGPKGPTSPITSSALSATASVSPASQSLVSCSAAAPTFTFSGRVTDSKAGTVQYHWRLPGGSGPARTLRFSRAGTQTVTTAYTPGSDNASGSGALVITSPATVSSNPAAFTLSCGQGLGITNDAPTFAQDGQAYSGTVTASGGTSPYTWSVTGLPGGLTASGGGATLTISGDPTAAGTFTPQISVHDSATPELTATTSFTLTVDGAAESPLVISGYLADAVVNQPYSATVIGTGGDGAYSWTVTGLPDGLVASPNGGTLSVSGTPTASGSFPVAVTVSDTESPAQTAAAGLTLVVASPGSSPSASPSPSSISTSPSPSPSSSLSPSPTPSPSLSTDDGGSPNTGGGVGSGGGLTITLIALPPGTVGDGYTAIATAIGGDGPYTWSAKGLPAGLVIHPRTGTISGTPTASGTFKVDLKVTGSGPNAQAVSVRLPLTISPAIAPNPGST
jgi:eukaryotic-like serine/threonine-protein kinase